MLPLGVTRVLAWAQAYDTYPASVSASSDLSVFRYIGLHSNRYILAISLDIDIKGWQPENSSVPEPNWVTTNPETGHSHAVWFFDGVVDKENHKQSSYLAAISKALAAKISASNATVRNRNATQNPFHPYWKTRAIHACRYSLSFLAESVGVDVGIKDFVKSDFRKQGRNNALYFDTIRQAQRHDWSPETISNFVRGHNHVVGSEFGTGSLPDAEVRSITNSVCRSAAKGYPYMRRTKAATQKRKRCNPNSVSARASALGISRSTFYAKRLHTLVGAVKHAANKSSDTTTELVFGFRPVPAVLTAAASSGILFALVDLQKQAEIDGGRPIKTAKRKNKCRLLKSG